MTLGAEESDGFSSTDGAPLRTNRAVGVRDSTAPRPTQEPPLQTPSAELEKLPPILKRKGTGLNCAKQNRVYFSDSC